MSQNYDNTNRGAIFKNDTEGKSENFPPYGGSLNVDGVEYWVSAWVKDGNKGKFFSLQVKPKEARQERSGPRRDEFSDNGRQRPAPPVDDFSDSEIPF